MTYRVVLRAQPNGTWKVMCIAGKKQLFVLPYRKMSSATYMAAKLVDELLRNKHDLTCAVQDVQGLNMRIDLVKEAQRRKVRGN
jgi:hypothetical protein